MYRGRKIENFSERSVKIPPVGFILPFRASDMLMGVLQNMVHGNECLYFGASKHTTWWTHYFLFNHHAGFFNRDKGVSLCWDHYIQLGSHVFLKTSFRPFYFQFGLCTCIETQIVVNIIFTGYQVYYSTTSSFLGSFYIHGGKTDTWNAIESALAQLIVLMRDILSCS